VIDHYSPPGRTFTITADLDAAVKQAIKNLPESEWKPYRTAQGMATDREITETVHTMNRTKQAFRLIVLRWLNPQLNLFEAERYCYYAVATNREEGAAEVIWKPNGRGNSENCHKELKIGVGMEVAAATPAGNSRPTPCISPSACWPTIWPNCSSARCCPNRIARRRWPRCAGRCIAWQASWFGTRAG
jgi:hypothetical protein